MAIDLERPADAGAGARGGVPRGWAALAGLVAAGSALGVGEVLSALLPGAGSPVGLVGERVIDLVPPAVKDLAIALFGTADKVALVVGTLLIALAAGALLGALAARRFLLGAVGFAAFAAVGVAAAAFDVQASPLTTALAVVGGAGVGLALLRRLLLVGSQAEAADGRGLRQPDDPPAFDRRSLVRLSAAAAGVAVVAGAGGQTLGRRARLADVRQGTVLPAAADALPPPPPGSALDVEGISALFTPTTDFFRIDTALSVPRVDLSTWALRVTGMVDRPFGLGYDELLDLPLVEADVTLTCVSNEVGGNLVGNARWLGVPLGDLLERAGVQPAATQLVGRSVDGWTAGFPTALARDGRSALVAVAMNGEPLPLEHGYPARLVVPGLYGYVSATKWLAEIELTTWDGFDGYWVPRGWAKEGPVKTQSRIDVPRQGRTIPAGPTAVAGVAWAQGRGIGRVEVRVDEGTWEEAELSDPLGEDIWRQWVYRWEAPQGRHRLEVRATDGDGALQTGERQPPAPDGATGWHRIEVEVAAA